MKTLSAVFITLLIIHVSASELKASESIYLIYGQIGTDLYQGMPFPIKIFKFEAQNSSLIELWSNRIHDKSVNILNLFETGILILQDENGVFRVFNYSDIPNNTYVDLSDIGPISRRSYYLEDHNKSGAILVSPVYHDPSKNNLPLYRLFNIDNGKEIINGDKEVGNYSPKLSGIISPYGNGTDNLCNILIDSLGVITARSPKIDLGSYVIPDDLIQMHSSKGWNVIANENDYLAILSVPEKHGLVNRELLIYNKSSREWSSILIPGARTAPTIVNNFLAGIIAEVDPNTDYELLIGYPPILSDSTVIINPMTALQFTVKLGENSEVLWIENSTAYYRVGDSLFSAQMQNNDLVNKQLILKDEKIKHIHWAFMVSSQKSSGTESIK